MEKKGDGRLPSRQDDSLKSYRFEQVGCSDFRVLSAKHRWRNAIPRPDQRHPARKVGVLNESC